MKEGSRKETVNTTGQRRTKKDEEGYIMLHKIFVLLSLSTYLSLPSRRLNAFLLPCPCYFLHIDRLRYFGARFLPPIIIIQQLKSLFVN